MKNTKLHRTLQSQVETTFHRYGLIHTGDRILVGVSGGKDSLGLWQLLTLLPVSQERKITLFAAHIEPGLSGSENNNSLQLANYFRDSGWTLYIKKEYFGEEILSESRTKNPCFICSRRRRRSLFELAEMLRCNKVALAHHRDDVIETLLLNIFYSHEIATMTPVQPMFKGRYHLIRPLYETEEKLLAIYAREQSFPILPDVCPFSGDTKRQQVKEMLHQLQKENRNVKQSIFQSLFHVNHQFLPKIERN